MTMGRLRILIVGELSRLNKYNVFSISILVAIIWSIVLFFIDDTMLSSLLPFVLLVDASLMSVMYIGSVTYFEKIESTISTLLVTPITNSELVLSKVIANTIHNLFSSSLIIIAFYFIRDIELNFLLLFFGLILTTMFFTIAGLSLSYYQKDFTSMLMTIMALSFIFLIPTILYMINILTWEGWEYILLINPIQAAEQLIGGGFKGAIYNYQYYIGLIYMGLGSVLLYLFHTLPKFQTYAIRQSGV
ncbi:MAG: hypothetical protein K9L26_03455 [Candidatus Izimaplasma sp.]|nr:hypothetical protein [Candidatus Izimaplasma bacterium]